MTERQPPPPVIWPKPPPPSPVDRVVTGGCIVVLGLAGLLPVLALLALLGARALTAEVQAGDLDKAVAIEALPEARLVPAGVDAPTCGGRDETYIASKRAYRPARFSCSFASTLSPAEVSAFYRDALRPTGWRKDSPYESDFAGLSLQAGTGSCAWIKEGHLLQVDFGPDPSFAGLKLPRLYIVKITKLPQRERESEHRARPAGFCE